MKNILILNMCNRYDFYGHAVEIIEQTWAKPIIDGEYENISYYSCGCMTKEMLEDTEHISTGAIDEETHSIFLPIVDEFVQTYDKFLMLLKTIKSKAQEADYILIVNPCVYVNVPLMNGMIENLPDNDKRILCGRIYAPKYSCGPYLYSYYGGFESLLLSRREYFDVLTKAKHRVTAIQIDRTNAPEYYMKYKMYSAQNATGFILNSKITMDAYDFRKYYQDWNMPYFGDIDEEEWTLYPTILVRQPGHECGFNSAKYRYIHEIISNHNTHHRLDYSFLENYFGKQTTVYQIIENNDATKEPETYEKDGNKFEEELKKGTASGKKLIKVAVYSELPSGYENLWSVTSAIIDSGWTTKYVYMEIATDKIYGTGYTPTYGKDTPVIPPVDEEDNPVVPFEPETEPSSIDMETLTSNDPNHWAYDKDRNAIPDVLEWKNLDEL